MQFNYNLKISNVVYSWGKTPILNNISFELTPGTITGLIGANGAGKSTLVRVISGDLHAHSGTVTVNKTSVYDLPCRAEIFGVSAEAYGYPSDLSVRNLISYWKTVLHIPADRINKLVALYKIKPFWRKQLKKLSTGQRKRVQLAMAFITNPPILLLDEPFTGLDGETTQITRNLITEARDSGKAVLLITHLFPELQRLASSSYILSGHKLREFNNVDEDTYIQLLHQESLDEEMNY